MQRGRDHGLPRFNQVRLDYGLPAYTSFSQLTTDTSMQAKLASAYNTVDDIDAWVGLLVETHQSKARRGLPSEPFSRIRSTHALEATVYGTKPIWIRSRCPGSNTQCSPTSSVATQPLQRRFKTTCWLLYRLHHRRLQLGLRVRRRRRLQALLRPRRRHQRRLRRLNAVSSPDAFTLTPPLELGGNQRSLVAVVASLHTFVNEGLGKG